MSAGMSYRKIVLLVLGVFLVSVGASAFAYAAVMHSYAVDATVLTPEGWAVPLHSVVQPTDFKTIVVRGWAYSTSGEMDATIYYRLVAEGEITDGWRRIGDVRLTEAKRSFTFNVSRDHVQQFLDDFNLSELNFEVHVVVVPKGTNPDEVPYVVAAEFKGVDMLRKAEEMLEGGEEESGSSDNTAVSATSTTTTASPTETTATASSGRRPDWRSAPRYSYDVERVIEMYTKGDEEAASQIRELLSRNEAGEVEVNSPYALCKLVRVGDPGFVGSRSHYQGQPSATYPSIICVKPNKERRTKVSVVQANLPEGMRCMLTAREDRGGEKCYTWTCTYDKNKNPLYGTIEKKYCSNRYRRLVGSAVPAPNQQVGWVREHGEEGSYWGLSRYRPFKAVVRPPNPSSTSGPRSGSKPASCSGCGTRPIVVQSFAFEVPRGVDIGPTTLSAIAVFLGTLTLVLAWRSRP